MMDAIHLPADVGQLDQIRKSISLVTEIGITFYQESDVDERHVLDVLDICFLPTVTSLQVYYVKLSGQSWERFLAGMITSLCWRIAQSCVDSI